MNIDTVSIINLPRIIDARGNLSFFEENEHIPFEINRVYWIYDVPGGEVRGGHAYQELQELIVALSGSFDVVINDGVQEKKFTLNRSYFGILIPKMIWRKLENFSTNSLCLIAASAPYNPSDYIRDYRKFVNLKTYS